MSTTSNQDREFGSYFLGDILDWITRNFNPEDVFNKDKLKEWAVDYNMVDDIYSENDLTEWAEKNGWVKE